MSFNSDYTGQQVDDLLDLFASGGTVAKDFRGALVNITAGSQAILAATAADAIFDTEVFDTDAFADLGTNNERLTVATGTTKVQVFAIITPGADLASAQDITLSIEHYNSADALQEVYAAGAESGHNNSAPQVGTPVIATSDGDYFKLEVLSEDAFTLESAFMSLEYKDGTLHVAGVTLEDAEKLVWQGI